MTLLNHLALLTFLSSVLVICALIIYCIIFAVYNLFFHPYARHSGPLWARVSPLYALWHAYYGDLHIDVLRCHERYGILFFKCLHVLQYLLTLYPRTSRPLFPQPPNLQHSRRSQR